MDDLNFFERLSSETGVVMSERQKEAITHPMGPLLLLATPGAGKTTVLNARIVYLILRQGVNPENILALTFSKAAAKEMDVRFQQLYGLLIKQRIRFSTIHSFCYNIVKVYYREQRIAFTLIENEHGLLSKSAVLKRLYEEINQTILTEDKLEELANALCFIKNSMIPIEEVQNLDTKVKDLRSIYEAYERYKKNAPTGNRLIDFDDMLTLANEILEENPTVLLRYQTQFPYVLTDESQDTSMIQNKIIEKVTNLSHNLFVVGDDDQSIFGFRAANPKYLLDFKTVHPGARTLILEQNYRSSPEIVRVSNLFIRGNTLRYKKSMFTENPSDQAISIHSFEYGYQQLIYIIKELKKKELLGQTAILYRNIIIKDMSIINMCIIIYKEEALKPLYKMDPIMIYTHKSGQIKEM
ncbi:MAG TPA: ATP-dependent helicase [Desulfosporosinus sp.]|nr:ATP-dependent helicase [Desulfosporosinus sp.]